MRCGAHDSEEDVVVGDDDNNRGVEGAVTIEAGEHGEEADDECEDEADQVRHVLLLSRVREECLIVAGAGGGWE